MASSQGWYPAGARSMSMANASVSHSDVWSYFNNPGSVAEIEELQAGLSYENRFLLKELQTQALAVAIPLKIGVISIGGHMYGYNQFRSYKGGIGYSMKLGEKLSAGVQMNYQGLSLNQNYGSRSSVTAEVGLYSRINDSWSFGASVINLGRSRLAEFEDDRFSTLMRLGTSYSFSRKVLISMEIEKDLDHKPRFKTGLEYTIVDEFFIRGGFATARPEFTFGFGYDFKIVRLDLGSSYDQILGWSPNFSLIYVGKK
jgi:hypothetical protein